MKKKLFLIGLAALTVVSCSKTTNEQQNNDDSIRVYGEIENSGKGSYTVVNETTGEADFGVGESVYVWYGTNAAGAAINLISWSPGGEFDYKGKGSFGPKLPTDKIEWNNAFITSKESYFVAIHPKPTNTAVGVLDVLPVAIPAGDQVAGKAFEKYDHLYSDRIDGKTWKLTAKPADRAVPFTFKHINCRIDLEIVKDLSVTDAVVLSEVSITGNQITNTGSMDIKGTNIFNESSITGNGTHLAVLKTPATVTTEAVTAVKTSLLCNPTKMIDGTTNVVKIVFKTTVASVTKSFEAPLKNIKLESGKRYAFSVLVVQDAVVIKSTVVSPWENVDGGSINAVPVI